MKRPKKWKPDKTMELRSNLLLYQAYLEEMADYVEANTYNSIKVKKGDMLFITFKQQMSTAQRDKVAKDIGEQLPGVTIAVLGADPTIVGVERTDENTSTS